MPSEPTTRSLGLPQELVDMVIDYIYSRIFELFAIVHLYVVRGSIGVDCIYSTPSSTVPIPPNMLAYTHSLASRLWQVLFAVSSYTTASLMNA